MNKKTKVTKPKAAASANVSKPAVRSAVAVKPVIVAAPNVKAAATPAAPVKPKARLEFASACARSVAVAGSFSSWQPVPLAAGKGSWVKELTLAPGRYEYLFVVDGQWVADPKAKECVPNPFGGQNSVFVI